MNFNQDYGRAQNALWKIIHALWEIKLTRIKKCILRVIDAFGKAIALCDCYASLMLNNLLHASITRQMHTNHEPRVNKLAFIQFVA